MSLLEVSSLTVRYGETVAVDAASFAVEAGESVGIAGESGAGKSQTALSLMGLLPRNASTSGSIVLNGTDVLRAGDRELRLLRTRRAAIVFQDPAMALNPYLRIGEQMMCVVREHNLTPRARGKSYCMEMLDRVGLPDPDRAYRAYPHQLSGGMRQRAHIATAVLGKPDLLIADEPTTALDVTVQAQILELLTSIRKETDSALLMITHDLGVISQQCDRLLIMDRGQVTEQGDCHEILRRPSTDRAKQLVAAVPDFRRKIESRPVPHEVLLEVESLSVHFDDRRRLHSEKIVAVENVSFDIREGETLAIVGESGSGKTSMARSISGLLPGDAGVLRFRGQGMAWRCEKRSRQQRRSIQMVFQDPVASLNPGRTIHSQVAESLAIASPELGGRTVSRTVTDLFQRVELPAEIGGRLPHELSGGQAQRVAIARALIQKPALLICDEALAALDGTVRTGIMDLLRREQQDLGLTLLMITHDLGVVHEMADRIIVMKNGRIVETASSEQLFASPREEYTKELLAAVPRLN